MEEKKLSFFKKFKTSIFDFDGYQVLAAEKVGRTIAYIAILMLIFSIIISAVYTSQIYGLIRKAQNYIDSEIAEISYEDGTLNVVSNSNDDTIRIDINEDISAKVIINTQTEDEQEIQLLTDELSMSDNGILILKDKVVIKDSLSEGTTQINYSAISVEYNLSDINKTEILDMLSGTEMQEMLAIFGVEAIIYMFIVYFATTLIDILILAILTFLVTKIAKLRLKYTAIYNISAYSLTLPIVLNILYFIINSFTGFTIEYFQVMYTGIASIYIITAVLMIKSDVVKKQMELSKIVEEQERIKQEIKEKEEREKEEQERAKRDREKEKQKEEKKSDETDKGINNEPEGDNA